jgi:hypothetical protein
MTVTYHHDHHNAEQNPSPLSHDALAAVGTALEAAARGDGPLTRARSDWGRAIMGSKLSPSPELHGHGAGTLEVDYADGTTRTFDVSMLGEIEPRRYAYALAAVIETDEPRGVSGASGADEEWFDNALSRIAHALPAGFPGEVVYASTPQPIPVKADGYDERPAGFGA